ncbi:hypothetical protein HPB51_011197 [Rhipicephalus microplus]|uniref:Uncharacterized protein n=1 Tax=Rhipicephalus microplus TaxID=6941 RepID=A0A9J6F2F5_RHIMP|nr:hypothetical protein HPB51_011197 [Rhipicephalus microplus]
MILWRLMLRDRLQKGARHTQKRCDPGREVGEANAAYSPATPDYGAPPPKRKYTQAQRKSSRGGRSAHISTTRETGRRPADEAVSTPRSTRDEPDDGVGEALGPADDAGGERRWLPALSAAERPLSGGMGAIEPPPPRVSRARPGAPLHAPRPRARQPRGPDHDSATRTATIPTDTPSDDRGWHGSDGSRRNALSHTAFLASHQAPQLTLVQSQRAHKHCPVTTAERETQLSACSKRSQHEWKVSSGCCVTDATLQAKCHFRRDNISPTRTESPEKAWPSRSLPHLRRWDTSRGSTLHAVGDAGARLLTARAKSRATTDDRFSSSSPKHQGEQADGSEQTRLLDFELTGRALARSARLRSPASAWLWPTRLALRHLLPPTTFHLRRQCSSDLLDLFYAIHRRRKELSQVRPVLGLQ